MVTCNVIPKQTQPSRSRNRRRSHLGPLVLSFLLERLALIPGGIWVRIIQDTPTLSAWTSAKEIHGSWMCFVQWFRWIFYAFWIVLWIVLFVLSFLGPFLNRSPSLGSPRSASPPYLLAFSHLLVHSLFAPATYRYLFSVLGFLSFFPTFLIFSIWQNTKLKKTNLIVLVVRKLRSEVPSNLREPSILSHHCRFPPSHLFRDLWRCLRAGSLAVPLA